MLFCISILQDSEGRSLNGTNSVCPVRGLARESAARNESIESTWSIRQIESIENIQIHLAIFQTSGSKSRQIRSRVDNLDPDA